ncbi:MAG: FAD:protein FMN transferase [Actinobacteria bacterium]|nr:FAD:protein FMN transferase [Actinomycetota bacterium]
MHTSFRAFGTFGALLVTRHEAARQARDILDTELQAIDLACSRFRSDSELTRLNAGTGTRHPVSPLLAEALDVALRAAAATDGAVDPTCGQSLVRLGYDADFAEVVQRASGEPVPPQPAGGWEHVELDRRALTVQVPHGVLIDLGATAKALAADRAAQAIAAAADTGVLVNLGGDIAVAGQSPCSGWRIDIDAAASARDSPRPVIAIRDGGLATSGPGARVWHRQGELVHHIVNPATGAPADSCWAVVSVAAATCVDANTASTAAIIKSAAAPGWLTGLGLPARLVSTTGAVVTTGSWPDES